MKILVFTDLHGNLNALNALIETEDFMSADERIFLGDVCIGFSRLNECIELLKNFDCIKILGNNDAYVCDKVPKADITTFSNQKFEQLKYMQNIIKPENKEIINSWTREYFLKIANKTFYFTHYPWEVLDNELSVIDSPIEKSFETRQDMFKNIDADYYIFGHEHKSNCFSNGEKTYYCLGTLGLRCPGRYLIINIKDGNVKIEEKLLCFNMNEEIDFLDRAGYPYDKNKIKRV